MKLYTKIIFLIILVAVGICLFSNLMASRIMRYALDAELQKQSKIIAQVIAEHIIHNVIDNEVIPAKEVLQKIINSNMGVDYAYVVGFDGAIFAYSFEGEFPRDLVHRAHQIIRSDEAFIAKYQTSEEPILDVAHPLINGMSAHIHIGMNESQGHNQIMTLRSHILIISLSVTLLSLLLGTFVIRHITNPLSRLAESMNAFGKGKIEEEIGLVGGGQEVEKLTITFNRMISERIKAEEALRESEKKYRFLFEQSNDAIIIHDLNGNIIDFNPRALEILGYDHDQLLNITIAELHSEEELGASQKALQETSEKGNIRFETRFRRSDGKVIEVEISSRIIDPVQKRIVQGIVRDITERKRAEEGLSKQHYFLQKAQEIGHIGTWELDINKNELLWTDENYRIFGIPIGTKLTYETFLDCVYPDDREYVDREWKAAFNKKPYDIEHRLLVDGKVKWVREKAELEFNEKDECIRGTGFAQDITERKLAEKALRVTRERLELAMDAGEHGFWDWNIDTNEVFFSPRYYTMLGYENKELPMVLDTWINLIHPEDRETIVPEVQKYAENAESYEIEFRLRCKDGSWKWISGCGKSFEIDENGVSHRAVGLHVDITERKLAEEALRESEKKYRLLAENASDVIWTRDMNLNLTYLSPSIEKLTEYSVEESMALPNSERFTAASMEFMTKIFEEELKLEAQGDGDPSRVRTIEIEMICKDGSTVWVEETIKFIRNETGQAVGMLGISRDVHERKQAEDEKRKMEAQLRQQQKMESVGMLAGGVAHEINNPINGIMNYAQLIVDRLDTDNPLSEFAVEIIHETERVAVIVRNLLAFARQEKQTHSPARMVDIIEQTLSLIRTVFRHDQITLEINVPHDLPKIKCRSQQIQQVIMNLMTNARDALNERYPEYDPDKKVSIISHMFEKKEQEWIRTTMEDHGAGIDPDIIERIFDPFFTTKPKSIGTGLGLSIIYGIVQGHHGKLHVETEPGQYTRFHLDLPVDNGWELE